jgi:acyl carrier protein
MDEFQNRLLRCFSSVFPELTNEEIRRASAETVAAWDSLASITLIAVLQEEFAVEIDYSDLPSLGSFGAVRDYIEKRIVAGSRRSASC